MTQLAVPLDGVAFILSGWSGQGSLHRALAGPGSKDGVNRSWNEKAVRRRANRILVEHVRSSLARWPRTVEEWRPHLPVTSKSEVLVTPTPRGRVAWKETSRRFGWPPRAYVTRQRHREIADVTITTLAWTVRALDRVLADARDGGTLTEAEPGIDAPLQAARDALALTTLPDVLPRPDRHDLESLKTSGVPWSYIEPVTDAIVRSETDLTWFAEQLLAPDPEFRWRFFHLAVLGHALMALRAKGAGIKWLAPMGAGESGPNFLASLTDGTTVDIWFEAGGTHAYYASPQASLYRQAVGPVKGSESSIGADVAMFVPSRSQALLLECKFSWSGTYVGRNGFHQAAAYALNEQQRWPRVWSYVVGPEETVLGTSRAYLPDSQGKSALGVTNTQGLMGLISDFLSAGTP